MSKLSSISASETVRQHARDVYLRPARNKGLKMVAINVGQVHKALALKNRIPLVCQALKSEKFLDANALRLVATAGPPSGQSTTVTYTYAFVDSEKPAPTQDPWNELRGALKGVFADLGGGESYLRKEREAFESGREHR